MKFSRTLTFAEKKVNFNTMDKFSKGLSSLLDSKTRVLIPRLIKKEEKAIDALVNIVTLIQKEAFEVGKKSASTEMKVRVPPTDKKVVSVMKENNKKIITKIVNDINKSLESKGFTEEEISIEFATETGIASQFINGLKTLFVQGSINMGREVIFEKYPEKIYAFQYSAILDGATTQLCRSLDDMVVNANDPARSILSPPNHWNCRSIWVEILQEETYKPPIKIAAPEDDKGVMKKYKDNALDLGIVNLAREVIKDDSEIGEL